MVSTTNSVNSSKPKEFVVTAEDSVVELDHSELVLVVNNGDVPYI